MINRLKDMLRESADSSRAEYMKSYLHSKEQFIGISLPEIRRVAKVGRESALSDIYALLSSQFHEEKMLGTIILVNRYKKNRSKEIVDFYIKNIDFIDNWDLTDTSAYILGDYSYNIKEYREIFSLSRSSSLWRRRVSVVATQTVIKRGELDLPLLLFANLLEDREPFMHKAIGWMLREVGKVSIDALKGFLEEHAKSMPSLMLSYAIEKFSKEDKLYYRNLRKSK